jgi:hypothetical protein
MNRLIPTFILAGFTAFGMQAVADNTPPDQSPADQPAQKSDQKEFMKDCMAKAKAAHNGMSEDDMKKACMDQWKSSMGNPNQPITPAH